MYNEVNKLGKSGGSIVLSDLLTRVMDGRQQALADGQVSVNGRFSGNARISGRIATIADGKVSANGRLSGKARISGRISGYAKANISLGGKVRGSLKNVKIGGKVGATASASVTGRGGLSVGGRALAGAGAAAGPVGVALALAPVIESLAKEVASDNERRVNENMAEAIADREKIQSEMLTLLESVRGLATEENMEDQQELAKDLLEQISKPESFAFSRLQGMGLQNQLQALSTNFGPSSMAALQPYQSDAELVAGKMHIFFTVNYFTCTVSDCLDVLLWFCISCG